MADKDAVILKEIGEYLLSATQKFMVAIEQGDKGPEIAFQKWWRPSTEAHWMKSKGFSLSPEESRSLGELLIKAGACVELFEGEWSSD